MVCNREGPLSGRALGVLEAVLSSQKGYKTDLCISLRLALLQVLQRLSIETVVHDLGRGHTAQGMCETINKGLIVKWVIILSEEHGEILKNEIVWIYRSLSFSQEMLWSTTQHKHLLTTPLTCSVASGHYLNVSFEMNVSQLETII